MTFRRAAGAPAIGLEIDDVTVLDVGAAAAGAGVALPFDPSDMVSLIAAGDAALAALRKLKDSRAGRVPLAEVTVLAPIPRPRKNVFCVGWNYLEHFEEGEKIRQSGQQLPDHPVFFSKAVTAVTGPGDAIPYDEKVTTKLDWEVELGVIIGRRGKNISEADAMQHVFGYTVINDVSARDLQRGHGGQWHKGKSLDGTCPMGPVIVTADELDPDNLRVVTRVNGETKQDSNTRHFYFKIPRVIAELSLGLTLEPGDVISTGTPQGVGFARTPPEYLKAGDLLETEIEGIGVLKNRIGG
ncbi:MAG TPA: fumarylacetoacetate hydrolase family protein [Pelomicrobium sp.]|nr:fumarylacetoacetate hydrolase family protein [Pelomicrobium sp.]